MNTSKSSTASLKSTSTHCVYCFDVIIEALEKRDLESVPNIALPDELKGQEAPSFVSWHTKSGDLRGCIGTFSAQDISENLPEYALNSAFRDRRFKPITKQEVPNLTCAVSLLTDFEKVKDAYEWEVGKHGILIELQYRGKNYRGTYLPDVAGDRNWSKDQTLKSLLKKAGCEAKLEDVVDSIQLERYQSSKHEISYDEYMKIKIA